jgi:hypothetical protein
MRSLFLALAILVAGYFASVGSAKAWCGPGCHVSVYGACVVDGWGTVRNECPAGNHPRPPCPYDMRWRHGACMPNIR